MTKNMREKELKKEKKIVKVHIVRENPASSKDSCIPSNKGLNPNMKDTFF